MTPQVAQAVDPIFLHVLDLVDRVEQGKVVAPQDECLRIRAQIDQAEALIGKGPEWDLIAYALVSWIDEMLVDLPWDGREWWSNNVLEVALFNTRLCNEEFYVKAQEASRLDRRDALEVYYVCVVLGFRGLYRDVRMAAPLLHSRGLPADVNAWAKQTAMAIRLGQGRPPLGGEHREVEGAAPRPRFHTKTRVACSYVIAAVLLIVTALYYGRVWDTY